MKAVTKFTDKINSANITIKNRLIVSNILMIVIPVCICLLIGAALFGGAWLIIDYRFSSTLDRLEQMGESTTYYEPLEDTVKAAIVLIVLVMAAAVIFSIYFANRFLTEFVFKKIEKPLKLLQEGAAALRDGNLDYRIDYTEETEFLPVCDVFNEMAVRLKESVAQTMKNEQSRKELLAGISHDIRSPLTSIQAYVEGLLDGIADTPEKQTKYLLTIKKKSESISGMVAQLFTFSKMELDDYPVNLKSCDIKKTLDEIISPLAEEYSHSGLEVKLNVQYCNLTLDTELLSRICSNVLSNSKKYNSSPSPHISIYSETDSSSYYLHLCDNGDGVAEDCLDKLFDVFYRSDASRNHPDKGSGLGLAIVANAAHKMNAEVMAKNADNGGLDIIIKFPME